MFRILLDSNRLAERVLAADRAAAAGREFYDDAFFAAFKRDALPIVDQRVADAISATAASSPARGSRRAARPSRPGCRDRRAGSRSRRPRRAGRPQPRDRPAVVTLSGMQVYLIPIGRDEYEPYFEDDEPDDADEPAETSLFGRLRRRMRDMLREAEAERHRLHETAAPGADAGPDGAAAPQGDALDRRARGRAAAAVAPAHGAVGDARGPRRPAARGGAGDPQPRAQARLPTDTSAGSSSTSSG